MKFARDLLAQARSLAEADPRRPRQANVRRAASSAYYALFHELTDQAAQRLVRTKDRDAHRNLVKRSFQHSRMAELCKAFAGPTTPDWLQRAGVTPSTNIREIARTFVFLQQERHVADYDLAELFTRTRARDAIARAEQAITAVAAVRNSAEWDFFILALLLDRPRR